jgi:hypothetical protein
MLSPLALDAPAKINGMLLDQAEAMLFRPGCEMHALAPTSSDWVSLMLPAAIAEPLLGVGQ